MDGKLIIFSAPSGAGKTSIVNYLLNLSLPLEFSISATKALGSSISGLLSITHCTASSKDSNVFSSIVIGMVFHPLRFVFSDLFVVRIL